VARWNHTVVSSSWIILLKTNLTTLNICSSFLNGS
jgi:hypothetical protein